MRISFVATLVPTVFCAAAFAQTPSFDCAKASAEAEQMICRDGALSALDQRLAAVYNEALRQQSPDSSSWFRAEQLGWVRKRNSCSSSSGQRACIENVYMQRIAEIQAQARLVDSRGPFTFQCTGSSGESDSIIATFFETNPAVAILERGGRSVIAFQTLSASGARYEALDVLFWDKGGNAQATWLGTDLRCVVASATSKTLAGTTARLVRIVSEDGQAAAPDDPAKYTIAFEADGGVVIRSDCNRGRGTWNSPDGAQLKFGPIAMTRAMCPPGSLDGRFGRDLGNVESYTIANARLILKIAGGAVYEFESSRFGSSH
jgi:uncharacterized protein